MRKQMSTFFNQKSCLILTLPCLFCGFLCIKSGNTREASNDLGRLKPVGFPQEQMEHLGLDPTDPLPPQDSLEQAVRGSIAVNWWTPETLIDCWCDGFFLNNICWLCETLKMIEDSKSGNFLVSCHLGFFAGWHGWPRHHRSGTAGNLEHLGGH